MNLKSRRIEYLDQTIAAREKDIHNERIMIDKPLGLGGEFVTAVRTFHFTEGFWDFNNSCLSQDGEKRYKQIVQNVKNGLY